MNRLWVHIDSSLFSLPPSPPTHPSKLSQTQDWVPCFKQLPTSYVFYTWQCICFSAALSVCPALSFLCCVHRSVVYIGNVYFSTLSVHHTLSFPDCVHKSVLYVCVSVSALQIGSSVLFFLGPLYMHWYTVFVFLLLTFFILYNRLKVHPHQFSWLKFVPFYGSVF